MKIHILVEHCTGIAEVMGSNPVQAWTFFRLNFRNCLSCENDCDDHSLIQLLDCISRRDKVTSILRLLLQRLGFATEAYASHSFSIGAATTAVEAGLPPSLSKPLGDGPATATPSTSGHLLQYSRHFLPN